MRKISYGMPGECVQATCRNPFFRKQIDPSAPDLGQIAYIRKSQQRSGSGGLGDARFTKKRPTKADLEKENAALRALVMNVAELCDKCTDRTGIQTVKGLKDEEKFALMLNNQEVLADYIMLIDQGTWRGAALKLARDLKDMIQNMRYGTKGIRLFADAMVEAGKTGVVPRVTMKNAIGMLGKVREVAWILLFGAHKEE